MKNSKKTLAIVMIAFIVEIILGYIVICSIDGSRYKNYNTANANITYVGHSVKPQVKSGEAYYMFFFIEYSDNNNIKYNNEITCYNFHKILKEGQTITIKYNPENPKEVIYPVYEESVMENKKTNLTIIFIITISLTFGFGIPKYISEKNSEIVSENVAIYLKNERDNFENLRF